ncbi:hypothetical protein Fot_37728 [Forsythia ovata]|uniref:Uncharacterized protein n=1 Tax=Forsythia ovata TaxID=205694 RepID=A0ABD1RZT3_9LAMI
MQADVEGLKAELEKEKVNEELKKNEVYARRETIEELNATVEFEDLNRDYVMGSYQHALKQAHAWLKLDKLHKSPVGLMIFTKHSIPSCLRVGPTCHPCGPPCAGPRNQPCRNSMIFYKKVRNFMLILGMWRVFNLEVHRRRYGLFSE